MKVLRKVKKKIKEDGAIVTIQNMFWIDRVSSLIDTKNAVFMQMDFSCYTINDKTIVIDRDGLKLGIVSKEAFDVMQKVTEALSPICAVEQENDIVGFLLGRNVLNIAISMLGAVSGKNLGLILKDKRGRKIFTKVICEGLSLFSAMGVNVLPYNKKLDYGTFARPCSEGKCYRKKIISILRKNNAMVSSSILQDIQLGHKSEVFTVVKTFIKHAQIRKVKIPTINILYTMINDIIKGKRRIDSRVFNEKIFKKLGD